MVFLACSCDSGLVCSNSGLNLRFFLLSQKSRIHGFLTRGTLDFSLCLVGHLISLTLWHPSVSESTSPTFLKWRVFMLAHFYNRSRAILILNNRTISKHRDLSKLKEKDNLGDHITQVIQIRHLSMSRK